MGSNIGKLFSLNSTQCNPHFPTISSFLLLQTTFFFKQTKKWLLIAFEWSSLQHWHNYIAVCRLKPSLSHCSLAVYMQIMQFIGTTYGWTCSKWKWNKIKRVSQTETGDISTLINMEEMLHSCKQVQETRFLSVTAQHIAHFFPFSEWKVILWLSPLLFYFHLLCLTDTMIAA